MQSIATKPINNVEKSSMGVAGDFRKCPGHQYIQCIALSPLQ